MNISQAIDAGFAKGMFQHRQEITDFLDWALTIMPLKLVLEIGSHRGGSSEMFLSLGAKVIAVDLPMGPWGGIPEQMCNERTADFASRFGANKYVSVLKDSHHLDTVNKVDRFLFRDDVDLLFIDGDHSLPGVMADFSMYQQFVKPGGIIALHDINPTPFHASKGVEVPRFWDVVKHISYTDCREFTIGAEWGGIGAIVL